MAHKQTLELTINIGLIDQEKYGLPDEVVNHEGEVVTVDERVAGILVKRGWGRTPEDAQRALTRPPAVAESPVANETVDQAKVTIDGMRSKEKVQAVIDNDSRSTVVDHARRKLASMG